MRCFLRDFGSCGNISILSLKIRPEKIAPGIYCGIPYVKNDSVKFSLY
ncbi:hypothetical protein LEP1GSC133_3551 [Leptospira borgpetersenii serovar Pomona str. 200901868]|uniref:Uncharacterized protein n=1 Tax=Leptospira borgpetersenii serovar Pomona str. 200901868 TaxID=1192866 RepID=M6W017_LEPBO|nr:hypothetical protein LEP1GSC133_3551 [Leptospira borgpetersenii serovar Pomona str. 200901868]